ncbi:MAG TPA: NAD-dependent epimerase/dehydratase family protein [Vicinamibacteria bacterium]|nr:NAD-dependent epimerase/dehydratase family protein [Vicinamibacteria bacterium]
MRKKVTLVTGAAGEVGTSLVQKLATSSSRPILMLDLTAVPYEVEAPHTQIQGDILDDSLLSRLVAEYEIECIFHLAALLSTRAEFTPEQAHRVNVEGTLELLRLASEQSQWRGAPVSFIFPSSIAVYGLPTQEAKSRYSRVREWEWTNPTTMYGCNKLYCELLGRYLSRHYKQLSAQTPVMIDFRSVRFPGLISAQTIPSGGTSDYAPEMLHAAAKGEPYHCFVSPEVRIPFMAMPDATKALLSLAAAPASALSALVYNVTSFSLSAAEIRDVVLEAFPEAEIDFVPDAKRQAIVDTWPANLDDTAARHDWKWSPDYDAERAFRDYLIPSIRERYAS